MIEVRVDISDCQTYADVERKTLALLQPLRMDDMIKVVLCGAHGYGLKKDVDFLTARTKERFFHLKIVDESRVYIEPSTYARDCTERGEFVREVYRTPIEKTLMDEILEVGLKALDGEDIDV